MTCKNNVILSDSSYSAEWGVEKQLFWNAFFIFAQPENHTIEYIYLGKFTTISKMNLHTPTRDITPKRVTSSRAHLHDYA